MTGLDKILEQIRIESISNADSIIEAANKKAEEILKDSEIKAKEEYDYILNKANEDISIMNQRAESAKELKKKQNILIKKQELIASLFDKAKDKILSLSNEEYFSFIKRIISKLPQNGTICFNSRDLERLDSSFKTYLTEKSFTVCNDSCDISGGCIVRYGDIEENCSLNALFESEKEILTDKVSKLIFG